MPNAQSVQSNLLTCCTVSNISYRNGGYFIQHCYDSSEAISGVIDKIRSHITKAIDYIDHSQTGDAAIYNAFFKGVDPEVVEGVLNRVAEGAPFFYSGRGPALPPSVICVAEGNPATQRQFNDCNWMEEADYAFHPTNTYRFVFLCPYFLSEDPEPTHGDCAKLSSRGDRLSHSPIGGNIQTSFLLHELVHLYLQKGEFRPEEYEINEVMALPAWRKAINPSNHVFFVGSESSSPSKHMLQRADGMTKMSSLSATNFPGDFAAQLKRED